MNCPTCRFELSQCLDGRLPSGRRALVMEHADACAECGTFWLELQAAQQLTLQLRRSRVGPDFRDSLWARIQAGEGTPEAVFHEPMPLVAKLRYALTGAAAAAAALLCAMWLAPEDEPTTHPVAKAESGSTNGGAPIPGAVSSVARGPHQELPLGDDAPLIASTQRLGFNLVAVEAAKQLEQRYAGTTTGLRRLAVADAGSTDEVVRDVLANAGELHDFGDLLLDLCDRKRLLFADPELESDLRVAVNMLAQAELAAPDLRTVHGIVAPALRSTRLASVSSNIAPVTLEPTEEQDVLARLTMQRPDIFPKLFVYLGNDTPLGQQFGLFRADAPLFGDERCGPIYAAPRSEWEQREGRMRVIRATRGSRNIEVHVHIREGGK
jgi:hypothetical protein